MNLINNLHYKNNGIVFFKGKMRMLSFVSFASNPFAHGIVLNSMHVHINSGKVCSCLEGKE